MNGNRKKDNSDRSFFILWKGQAFILVIYNENIPQLVFMKVLNSINEIIPSN